MRKSILALVMALLLCTVTGGAAVQTVALGGDWNVASNWANGDIADTVNDDVYTQNTHAALPLTLPAGDTATCRNLYFSLYDGLNGGNIQINGTLNSSLHIMYGNWWSPSAPASNSLLQVNDSGTVNIAGNVAVTTPNNTGIPQVTNTQVIDVAGGTLNVNGGIIGTGTTIEIILSGDGAINVTGTVSDLTGSIDIQSTTAQLVLQESSFNNLVSDGCILADGTAVTTETLDALLNVDSVTSPGYVIVSLNQSAPGAASNPSPANNATDVLPNQVVLSWTKGSGATSHDVYFGETNPPAYITNQSDVTYLAGLLADNTTYYWRIDEVNDYGTNTGTVWSFTTGVALANNTPPITNGAIAYWGASDAVSNPALAHTFTAAATDGTVADQNLMLDSTDEVSGSLWVYDCNAISTATTSTSHTIALTIPIDLRGWLWWDDPSTSRTIEVGQQYYNTCEIASIYTSDYPLAVVSNGTDALSLAVPLEPARPVRFIYDAENLELRAEFDFGFYYSATDPGMFFDNRADATVYAYQVSGETQAFRNALDFFYDIHEQELVRRTGTGGVFVTKSFPAAITDIEDFHIAYNDYGLHDARNLTYDPVHAQWLYRPDWNEDHGILNFVYVFPQATFRRLTRSYSGTFTATFDGDPADTGGLTLGADPGGSVTYTGDKAIIAPGGKLMVAGCMDRDVAERIMIQFTILNMDDFATVTESQMGVDVGHQIFGLRRSATAYGTGDVWKAGAWGYWHAPLGGEYDTHDGKAIPPCSTVTIRLIASPNVDNTTYVYAGYDGGDFEYVGRLIGQGGVWTTWSVYSPLVVNNDSGTPLEIDNLIVTHYSGATPADEYSNYIAQMVEDRDMGNLEQEAGAVSSAKDQYGNPIKGWADSGSGSVAYQFYMNTDVVHPDLLWEYKSYYEYKRDYVMAEALGWDDFPATNTNGYFHDLVLNGFWADYDQTHFAVATNPLTIDRSNGNAPVVRGWWSNHSAVRAHAEELHENGQLSHLNDVFGTETYRSWIMMPYADISGREIVGLGTSGNFDPPTRADFLHSRFCAARRPNWLMAYDNFEQDLCLKFMEYCMFYGIFPTFQTKTDTGVLYWNTPALYNRDRAYWSLYISAIQKIDNAGWEPVTHAMIDSGCYIERWGNVSNNDLYFTVYNPSPSTGGTVQVGLEGTKLGLLEQIKATPLIDTEFPVTVLNSESESPKLQFWMGSEDCRVIKLETYQKEDINTDNSVNILDFLYLAEYWLQADPPVGDFVEDNIINLRDFVRLAEVWLGGL